MRRRIGVLTGGGDCPGLNAVIRSFVAVLVEEHGHEVVGFQNAWDGIIERNTMQLDVADVRGILHKGGTVLGTRRGSPLDTPDGPQRVAERVAQLGLEGLVVIGGNGSLTVAHALREQVRLPVIGVPKTIDNDIMGTDVCFGFHTAVQIATDAIDRLHTTSESHDRIIVVEVMGRDAGWIAAHAALAGGACAVLLPEFSSTVEAIAQAVVKRHGSGRSSSIIVAAEGAVRAQGAHGALGAFAAGLQDSTGFDVRTVSLGHIQRGGTPTSYDRVLATRYGVAAADAVIAGQWGHMVAVDGNDMTSVDLSIPAGSTRVLDEETYALVRRALL
jgi:ATP-dependent phosphofructokinase / diphosphate-dependent phosphofructokinase